MTTIYLIRHSVKFPQDEYESYKSKDDKNLRDDKSILSVTGEERAKIICSKSELDNIDIVFASNMVRSQQTAKYLCFNQNKKMNIDERLNERKCGIENSDVYPDWYERQYLHPDFKTKNGESQNDVSKRMHSFLDEIIKKYDGKRIAVFSHGYAITFALLKWCKLVNVTNDRVLTYEFKNKIIMNKQINAPEMFKLVFEHDQLISVELIEFDDLPFAHAGI